MQKTAISLCISHTDHIIKGSFAAVAQKFQIKESWILIQKALKNTNKPAIVRRFNYYYKIYRIPLLSHYWRHMSGCPKYKIHRTEQQIKLNSNYIQIKEKQQKKNQWFDKKWQNQKDKQYWETAVLTWKDYRIVLFIFAYYCINIHLSVLIIFCPADLSCQ